MPPDVGIQLAHAALQAIAEDAGVHLLHIKGPARASELVQEPSDSPSAADAAFPERASVDADVLVRSAHVGRLFDALTEHGWRTKFRFEDGSAFRHASTMVHDLLAPVDVHRFYPGIGLDPGGQQICFKHGGSAREQVPPDKVFLISRRCKSARSETGAYIDD